MIEMRQKLVRSVLLVAFVLSLLSALQAQVQIPNLGVINTIAGTPGDPGYSGDGGPATLAELGVTPGGVAVDSSGNIYIADTSNYRIRKVTALTGTITTIAGTGREGYSGDGGPATSAELLGPSGIAVDTMGNVYFSDYRGGLPAGTSRIRKVTASTGIITSIVNSTGTIYPNPHSAGACGYSGDGGPATTAQICAVSGQIAVDAAGNLYIADAGNCAIRKVTASTGIISSLFGNPIACEATTQGVTLDSAANVYYTGGQRVYKLTVSTRQTTTYAGTGAPGYNGDNISATAAELNYPSYLALDPSGDVYIVDAGNSRIREVNATTGIITTYAGNGTNGESGDGGPATGAEIKTGSGWASSSSGIISDQFGNIYFFDGDYNVRVVGGEPTVQGYLNPKYKVLGVVYTAPGPVPNSPSYVQYTDTTMMGTTSSTSNTFSTNVTTSVTICGGAGIGDSTLGVKICGTTSNAFTQEADSSSSFAVNQTTSFANKWSPLTGPNLDHGNDVIYVWLNPQTWYTVYPNNPKQIILWNGYSYDGTDPFNGMDIVAIRLTDLMNNTIGTCTQAGSNACLIERTWAPNNTDGTGPGLTPQDLLNIASVDPFSDPNYTVTVGPDGKTTTDNRFTQTTNEPIFYDPGDASQYNWIYTTTATAGQGAKTTYAQSFGVEESGQVAFWGTVSYDFKESTTFTWVDQWNALNTSSNTQSFIANIANPPASYSGPNDFLVYQDNVYGTFMLAPAL